MYLSNMYCKQIQNACEKCTVFVSRTRNFKNFSNLLIFVCYCTTSIEMRAHIALFYTIAICLTCQFKNFFTPLHQITVNNDTIIINKRLHNLFILLEH